MIKSFDAPRLNWVVLIFFLSVVCRERAHTLYTNSILIALAETQFQTPHGTQLPVRLEGSVSAARRRESEHQLHHESASCSFYNTAQGRSSNRCRAPAFIFPTNHIALCLSSGSEGEKSPLGKLFPLNCDRI